MKQHIKGALGLGCRAFRIGRATARISPGRFVILMFHRVVRADLMRTSANRPLMMEATIFSRLAKTLAENCLCLPLEEALARAEAREYSLKPVVALTFDDGYADCHRTVYPVLKHHGLPATIYLTTGLLDDPGRFFWWDAVEAYFANPGNPQAFLDAGLPETFLSEFLEVAQSPSARGVETFIRGPMYRLDKAHRQTFLDLIGSGSLVPPAMLTWDQAREMSGSGLVRFGAHTVSHPFLDELAPAQAVREVLASKERIEAELDRPVASFAYPSGRVPAFHRKCSIRPGSAWRSPPAPVSMATAAIRFCCGAWTPAWALPDKNFPPAYFLALCSGCLAWLN